MVEVNGEPCWVEVDLEALRHNYEIVRQKIGPAVKLLGVVKADAYGHGIVPVSRLWEEMGIDMLGVTTVEEGKQLRQAGITIPILVFRPFLPEEIPCLAQWDLTATVAGREAIHWLKQWLAKNEGTIKVHLKVETGMGRYGFWPQEVLPTAQELLTISGLELTGVYSHLATAMWKNKRYSWRQFRLFQKVCTGLEKAGIKGLVKHIANSAAVLELPEMYLDMVRVGTLLYGQYPVLSPQKSVELKDTWYFKAKVVYIRKLPRGHTVGYGQTFKARRSTLVAVLSVGFVDGVEVEPLLKPVGFLDLLKGTAKLFLRYLGWQKFCPPVLFPGGVGRIIGKVGMQLTMVDVSRVKDIKVGTIASLPVRRTAVDSSIPKLYLEEGEIVVTSKTTRAITRQKCFKQVSGP
ncbi:MAG TPA: alanine racemase [Clostridia bacterium]|nr:alanine racemase [Clostridia bacterium]HHY06682.1 alanine racemase [Clostridia bacterium]